MTRKTQFFHVFRIFLFYKSKEGEQKMNNIKIATVLMIAGILLLSGCTGNEKSKTAADTSSNKNTPSETIPPQPAKTPVSTQVPISTIKSNLSSSSNQSIKNSDALVAVDWCKPGTSVIKSGKGLIVQGTVVGANKTTLCYAKASQSSKDSNTTTNYYFDVNGTVIGMNETSVSSSGNSSASSSASISITS